MATYHGLVQVSCLPCSWQSVDDAEIEYINDMDGCCPRCEEQFFVWRNQDGSIVVSLKKDKEYDNLVWKEEV